MGDTFFSRDAFAMSLVSDVGISCPQQPFTSPAVVVHRYLAPVSLYDTIQGWHSVATPGVVAARHTDP